MNYRLTPEEETLVGEATVCIDQVVKAGISAFKKFPPEKYDLKVFTYLNFLERFTVHLQSIDFMLKNYAANSNLETSIGLTIRAGLLDEMTMLYLVSFHADVETPTDPTGSKFDYEFNRILCDQINFTFKYLREAKNAGFTTNDEYKAAIDMTFANYSFLFVDTSVEYSRPEFKLISSNPISPVQMFKRIHNHPLTNKFSKVYDLYSYYSKYEHFGMMAHFMQRQESNIHIERILGSLSYLIHGMGGCFTYLSSPLNLLAPEIQKLNQLNIEFDKILAQIQDFTPLNN